jgi:hypothetical protein
MAAAAIPETCPTLTDSVKKLAELVSDPDSDLPEDKLPGLDKLINDWYDDGVTVDQEEFARRILSVFKNSTVGETVGEVYEKELNKLLPSHKDAIENFVAGEIDLTSLGKTLAPTVPLIEDVQDSQIASTTNNVSASMGMQEELLSEKHPELVSQASNAEMVAPVSYEWTMASPNKLFVRAIVAKKQDREFISVRSSLQFMSKVLTSRYRQKQTT